MLLGVGSNNPEIYLLGVRYLRMLLGVLKLFGVLEIWTIKGDRVGVLVISRKTQNVISNLWSQIAQLFFSDLHGACELQLDSDRGQPSREAPSLPAAKGCGTNLKPHPHCFFNFYYCKITLCQYRKLQSHMSWTLNRKNKNNNYCITSVGPRCLLPCPQLTNSIQFSHESWKTIVLLLVPLKRNKRERII